MDFYNGAYQWDDKFVFWQPTGTDADWMGIYYSFSVLNFPVLGSDFDTCARYDTNSCTVITFIRLTF